jgi:hypothetical protein
MSITLAQLQELKTQAKKVEVEKEWNLCLDFLKANPLTPFITKLFEVQAEARQFGLNVVPGYDNRSWYISIPEAKK